MQDLTHLKYQLKSLTLAVKNLNTASSKEDLYAMQCELSYLNEKTRMVTNEVSRLVKYSFSE